MRKLQCSWSEHTQLANILARDVVQWGQWLADTVWWIDNSSGKFLVVIARYADCYMYRRETSWKRKITAPQVAGTSLGSRHAPGGSLSNYVAQHRLSSLPPYHNHTSTHQPAIPRGTKKIKLKIITKQLHTLIRQYALLFFI